MVLLHFKKTEGNEFLYESTMAISIDQLLEELVESKFFFVISAYQLVFVANNLRLKLDRAAVALEDLASKGPLKPEGLRGLDPAGYEQYLKAEDITVTDGLKAMPPRVGTREVKDDTHYRTGWLLSEEMTQKMLDQAMEIKKLIHKSSVE